jgi:hypothetical protein
MQQLRGVDLLMYLRALGLLVRNPSIIVIPLLMAVIGVLLAQVSGVSGGGAFLGGVTGGIASFIQLLLELFGFGTACIIADAAWRNGRASFDASWEEARRKGGEILVAALGFTFVLYVAQYAGSLVGVFGLIVVAAAIFFLLYTIPAAAIGGVPGGAALQVSIDRARSNPLPTIITAVVAVAALLYIPIGVASLLALLVAPVTFASYTLVVALIGAVAQAITIAYLALIVTKTYTDISFGRRY